MRRTGSILVVAGAVIGAMTALPAQADEVYSWKDRGGTLHYSNVPTENAAPTDLHIPTASFTTSDDPNAGLGPGEIDEIAAETGITPGIESTVDGLQNQKQLKSINQRLANIDRELNDLAQARTSHAGGTPETGGLGTNAAAYLSPEEEALGAEREQLVKQAEQLRSDDTGIR
jgi:hypothetical protein